GETSSGEPSGVNVVVPVRESVRAGCGQGWAGRFRYICIMPPPEAVRQEDSGRRSHFPGKCPGLGSIGRWHALGRLRAFHPPEGVWRSEVVSPGVAPRCWAITERTNRARARPGGMRSPMDESRSQLSGSVPEPPTRATAIPPARLLTEDAGIAGPP